MSLAALDTPVPGPDDRAPDLAIADLSVGFAGTRVLDRVTARVGRGEAVALVGPNGAGKSTLLRATLRLVEAEAGAIGLLGERVDRLRPGALRRLRARVGFVFQRHNLVPRLSALSNVVHGVQARAGGPRTWVQWLAAAEHRAEAMRALDRVGLAGLARRRADRLSGGQSQRVAIARVLMQRPAFVLADEPVASLDPTAAEEVMALFAGLMRDEGLSVLFTTHNMAHARRFADRVVALAAGRVVFDLPAGEIGDDRLAHLFGAGRHG